MLACTYTPMNWAAHPTVKKLFENINHRLTVKHPTTYSHLVEKRAEEVRVTVMKIIKNCAESLFSASFTTDMWTSRAMDAYISLTLHYIDSNWVLIKWVTNIRPFPERHFAENIEIELSDMINNLGLNGALAKFMTNDNGSNIVLVANNLECVHELRCVCYTCQLAVGETFKSVQGMQAILNKCKNLASWMHKSGPAWAAMQKEAKQLGVSCIKLKNPGDTRWYSWLFCMESVLKMHEVMASIAKEDSDVGAGFDDRLPTNQEMRMVRGAVKMLTPVKEMGRAWEAEKCPTINLVVSELFNLTEFLKDFVDDRRNRGESVTFGRALLDNCLLYTSPSTRDS